MITGKIKADEAINVNKVKLKTLKLQEMVARSIRGASNNRMVPLTQLMEISLKDGILTLTTYDTINVLRVFEKDMPTGEFYAVVHAEVFSKLIAKTTSEFITLKLIGGNLEVEGNGKYTISLPLNEDGELIKLDSKVIDLDSEEFSINLSTIKKVLEVNKAAVAKTMEIPVLTGYLFGDNVITSDTFTVCSTDIQMFPESVLLYAQTVELLALMNSETIKVRTSDTHIYFVSDNVSLYSYKLEGIENFPLESIQQFLDLAFESSCKIPKMELMNLLDRLSLFIGNLDKNVVNLTFTPEGILFSTKKDNSTELIKYQGSENFKPYTCSADIELLKSQISPHSEEVLEFWYGHDAAIKVVSGKTTQIFALVVEQ